MSQPHCTISTRTYKHLSEAERGQIEAMLRMKASITDIASALGRHPTTIYRESIGIM